MNRELFSGIIREHHSPLMAYARMITGNAVSAGDVVQDSFVKALIHLDRFEEIVSEWQADRPEIFDHLAGCREQLPAPLAESINAYYDQSLSTDEAAAQLGINGATLRKRLERAREALRECVQNKQATK